MPLRHLHPWDVTPDQAIEIQKNLSARIIIAKLQGPIHLIAGTGVSFDKGSDLVYAGVVVLRLPDLVEVARATAVTKAKFPYIPGLLSFRESPPVLEAWEKLKVQPDAMMIDGQGVAHPRRFGIASHLGLLLGLPSVGCAKSLLVGKYEEPPVSAGSCSPIIDGEETIGVALRTRYGINPVFVSIGHKMDLQSANALVMNCTRGYRIPEPLRRAHVVVNALREGKKALESPPQQESLF
jgi:deoxyribonuclease V